MATEAKLKTRIQPRHESDEIAESIVDARTFAAVLRIALGILAGILKSLLRARMRRRISLVEGVSGDDRVSLGVDARAPRGRHFEQSHDVMEDDAF